MTLPLMMGVETIQVDESFKADLTKLKASELNHIAGISEFDAVCLDAPCSNTGVIRRRPDARWRLKTDTIKEQSNVQLNLLQCAGQFVARGGRLLYSTCSIEEEENQGVVDRFIKNAVGEFKLAEHVIDFPPDSGHDGGGCFLLRRK